MSSIDADYEIIKDLVKKYDRPGPRYTSYPTVPNWGEKFGAGEYREALKQASLKPQEPLSLYVHIPFCRRRCWYCGCNTTVDCHTDDVGRYLAALQKEIAMIAENLGQRKRVSQLHWGGGTPTYLSEEQTAGIFKAMAGRFDILPGAEVSMELDPRLTDETRIAFLKKLGFNRLSFGVQDFNPKVQAAIGRNQDEARTVALYQSCRREGFSRINFDLIYGLPWQTVESFRETIDKVTALHPDRVALYSYAHLPQAMPHQKNIDPQALPDAETKFALFYTARKMFGEAGYVQIGMDHFVLPEDELAVAAGAGKLRRNFMGYTIDAAIDWVGFGMSAIGYVQGGFAQNISRIEAYIARIESGEPATFRGIKLTADDLIRQKAISDLMCNFRLDMKEMKALFGIDGSEYFQEERSALRGFIEDKLVEFQEDRIVITPSGKIFVRNIAMLFDKYLSEKNPGKSKAQFSRTI